MNDSSCMYLSSYSTRSFTTSDTTNSDVFPYSLVSELLARARIRYLFTLLTTLIYNNLIDLTLHLFRSAPKGRACAQALLSRQNVQGQRVSSTKAFTHIESI